MTTSEHHQIRPVCTLNGLWDFEFLGDATLDLVSPRESYRDLILVPSAFDALPEYAGKRGVAAYRTRFEVPPGHPARVEFGAVSMRTRIFIDGVLAKEHACGYSPFAVDIPRSTAKEREVVVAVDNRFDFERAPMHEGYFDFYQYGGILRDVHLHVLPAEGQYLRNVHVSPTERYAEGEVNVAVELGGELKDSVTLLLEFDGGGRQKFENLPVTDNTVKLRLMVPSPQTWSPESPHLHKLCVTLGNAGSDDLSVSFGLRRIEARDGALWLNGSRLELRGYNRHEWHPNFGPSTPVLQMFADLQLLRDMGCNFVRGSHYPQDQNFLTLCDRMGILVWEENLGWGQRHKTFESETWKRHHEESLREMIEASFNHPSVIMWGFLNEAGTKEDYPRAVIEQTARIIRELDPSRPLTYATMYALEDRHLDLVDIISLNIYPGWYGCEDVERPLELIAPHIRKCLASLDERGFSAKPVLISEIGAEALPGWHDAHNGFFTEEYQAEYLRCAATEALANPRCSGIALWHFSDARTYGGGRPLLRPRAFNNKGTLDEYRRPKAAYAAVREVFRNSKNRTLEAP